MRGLQLLVEEEEEEEEEEKVINQRNHRLRTSSSVRTKEMK